MGRLLTVIGCACIASTLALSASQSDQQDKDQMGKEMKVTGCVAQGHDADHFMLSNAMISGEAMKSDMKPSSYELMGGDLKAHVGHKVEVTGVMADYKMIDHEEKTAEMKKMDGSLTVKSVKMISTTCP